MITEVTAGIKVSVETFYRPDQSHPKAMQHVFAYRITIENNSEYSIQLKRRHWYIYDSNGYGREVEGEGVVGEQPVIAAGATYRYVSGCNLESEIGKMYGSYKMKRQADGTTFYVKIPEFMLIVPFKLN